MAQQRPNDTQRKLSHENADRVKPRHLMKPKKEYRIERTMGSKQSEKHWRQVPKHLCISFA